MSQGPLCPNLTQKVQKEVSQIANRNLPRMMLLGGLSVNLNHLKILSSRTSSCLVLSFAFFHWFTIQDNCRTSPQGAPFLSQRNTHFQNSNSLQCLCPLLHFFDTLNNTLPKPPPWDRCPNSLQLTYHHSHVGGLGLSSSASSSPRGPAPILR